MCVPRLPSLWVCLCRPESPEMSFPIFIYPSTDNFDRSLLRCMESSADAEFDSANIGVWMVRVCTSDEQHRLREVPEMALRSVPRSIALSLEVPVDLDARGRGKS